MNEATRPKDWPREWYLYETANEKVRRSLDWNPHPRYYTRAPFYSLAELRERYEKAIRQARLAASHVGRVA